MLKIVVTTITSGINGGNIFEKGHNGVDLYPKPGYFGDVSTNYTHERPAGSLVTVFLVSL